MKKVNVVISRKIPDTHPRAGLTTRLRDKHLRGAKIHTEFGTIAYNYGLSREDFFGWFFPDGRTHYMEAIIHFTDFRY